MPGVNAILWLGHRWCLHATRCTGALTGQKHHRRKTCLSCVVWWLSVVVVLCLCVFSKSVHAQELNRLLCDRLEEQMKGTLTDGEIKRCSCFNLAVTVAFATFLEPEPWHMCFDGRLFEGEFENYIECALQRFLHDGLGYWIFMSVL